MPFGDEQVKITWKAENNEVDHRGFQLNEPTPCTNQSRDFGGFTPLCISFKPHQEELVWQKLDNGWVMRFKRDAK